jgi:hypothetical protein
MGVGALLLVASAASAQVVGSHHDFTVLSGPNEDFAFYTRSSATCATCHAIHNAMSTDAPLWDHTFSTATYTVYTSPTMNAVASQPVGVSRACLSCHDGTVAVNSVAGEIVTGGQVAGPVMITGEAMIGTDLSGTHPISIAYDAGDTDLNPMATVQGIFPLYGPTENMVECGSCHDPHFAGGRATRPTPTEYRSRCIVCHNK